MVFMTPLVDQTVTEGETAILTVTSGKDLKAANVKWYRNGALLDDLGSDWWVMRFCICLYME